MIDYRLRRYQTKYLYSRNQFVCVLHDPIQRRQYRYSHE